MKSLEKSSLSESIGNSNQEIKYECDKCKRLVKLIHNSKESIVCLSCGHRILSKLRTKIHCEFICR